MQEDRYIWFIYQQLRGELLPDEEQELSSWLEASEDNRKLADRIATAWTKSIDYPDLPEVDLDKEFYKLKDRIRTSTPPARPRFLFSPSLFCCSCFYPCSCCNSWYLAMVC